MTCGYLKEAAMLRANNFDFSCIVDITEPGIVESIAVNFAGLINELTGCLFCLTTAHRTASLASYMIDWHLLEGTVNSADYRYLGVSTYVD
jgi:hypothetical protein